MIGSAPEGFIHTEGPANDKNKGLYSGGEPLVQKRGKINGGHLFSAFIQKNNEIGG